MLAVVGFYFVQRFRGGAEDDDPMSHALTDFREMHHRGELGDAEYRDVKAVVAAKLQQRLQRRQVSERGDSENG